MTSRCTFVTQQGAVFASPNARYLPSAALADLSLHPSTLKDNPARSHTPSLCYQLQRWCLHRSLLQHRLYKATFLSKLRQLRTYGLG
ncbi:hypothetical protein M422DRAFT_242490 [Sphaerobolus stellatus SS14]|nr:hypothetical protein M422DRAFT_242490 [Sphaerobolus stellatus SS14]